MKQKPSQKTSPKNSIPESPTSQPQQKGDTSWVHAEYKHGEETWAVTDFNKLAKFFEHLTPENLPALHALAESRRDFEKPWGMVRWLCAIRPALMAMDADPRRLTPLGKKPVSEIYQCSEDEVDLSVHYLQAAWNSLFREEDLPEIKKTVEEKRAEKTEKPVTEKLEFTMQQLAMLELGAFSTEIFDYDRHSPHSKYVEVEWFCGQIEDVRKVFEEPMAKEMAHLALQNSLQLRRINDRLVALDPIDKDFLKLQDVKTSLEETYRRQWEKVCEICPVAAASATRKSSVNNLSDIVKVYQEYKSDANNRARDGIFTDDEIQILFRTSVQNPDVGYRLGWVLAANEAKQGLDDPKWKRRMRKSQCKILDASFKYAAKKLTEAMDLGRPDLEDEGPSGEHDAIYTKPDGEISDMEFVEGEDKPTEDSEIQIPEPTA